MAKPPVPLTTYIPKSNGHQIIRDVHPLGILPGRRISPLPLLLKENITMQQMQGPEGRSYNEGYLESVEYPTSQNDEQAAWSRSQYESQQKLQPESEAKLSTTHFVMTILSVVASSLIMGLSIALVALTANIFGRTIGAGVTDILPESVFGIIIASFVISLLLLLCSITGFVFSTIQLSMMVKKLKRVRGAAKSRPRYQNRPQK